MNDRYEQCEFYDRINNWCIPGGGSCIHKGDANRCLMKAYYNKTLEEGNLEFKVDQDDIIILRNRKV